MVDLIHGKVTYMYTDRGGTCSGKRWWERMRRWEYELLCVGGDVSEQYTVLVYVDLMKALD